MSIFETLGFMIVLFCSLIGFAAFVYCAYRGAMLLKKQVSLGESCLQEADAVMDDVRVPVFRPMGVR